MQKMQTSWVGQAARLVELATACPLSHKDLAKEAKVTYDAVYRLRRKGVVNRGKNTKALCKFFCISENSAEPPVTTIELANAAVASWDGTAEHAHLLLDLMRCAGRYRATARGQGRGNRKT